MARTKFVISNVDTVKAQKCITDLLLGKKAKEIQYKNERVWQFDNIWIGCKYLKIEYGHGEVVLYGWVPIGFFVGEQALTAGIGNWYPRRVVKNVMKEIEVLLKRECSLNMNQPGMHVTNTVPVTMDPVPPIPVTPVQITYNQLIQQNTVESVQNAETIYKEAMSEWTRTLVSKENKDFTKSFALFMQAANMEHPGAIYQVGYAYSTGWGVPKNEKTAFEWYLKAAEMGYCDGERTVGRYYQEGKVVERNLEKAREWYQRAITKGDIRAAEWFQELSKDVL